MLMSRPGAFGYWEENPGSILSQKPKAKLEASSLSSSL